jgi:hypothetical protein
MRPSSGEQSRLLAVFPPTIGTIQNRGSARHQKLSDIDSSCSPHIREQLDSRCENLGGRNLAKEADDKGEPKLGCSSARSVPVIIGRLERSWWSRPRSRWRRSRRQEKHSSAQGSASNIGLQQCWVNKKGYRVRFRERTKTLGGNKNVHIDVDKIDF